MHMKRPCDKEKRSKESGIFVPGRRENAVFLAQGALAGLFICWIVYNSWQFIPVAAAAAAAVFLIRKREAADTKRRAFLIHFSEYVRALHTSVRSGYSLENAAANASASVKDLYGEASLICSETKRVSQGVKVGRSVEEMFSEMGERCGLEDVVLFAELIVICKRSGGDIGKLLSDTGRILDEKAGTEKQIQESLAGKRMELKVMSLMPALIVLYVRLCFTGFSEVLYGNSAGVVLMSVCLVIYAAAYLWGLRMVDIRV